MPNNIEDLDREIQECLDTFQNAVFGEDVRSALIQAIEICYEKVVELAVTHILSGKSAYQLAQENGFSGTLQEWLDSLKGDPGPTGPQGPEGPPGQIEGDGFDVDNVIDANSANPVQNKVIKAALDEKISTKPFARSQSGQIITVSTSGGIAPSAKKCGGTLLNSAAPNNTLATETAVKNYTYSKTESDSKYLTEHQDISGKANTSDVYTKTQSDNKYLTRLNVDSIISSTSINPVQNSTIKAALDSISASGVVVDTELSPISENPVQNKVIAEALQDVVTDDIIWEDIDASLSFENPNNIFTGERWFPGNGLFVERYYDSSYNDSADTASTKYRYFLAYIDSNADSDVDPSSSHWHRIIELTGLFESKQWQCQHVNNLPPGAIWTKYYPSLNCMAQYVSMRLNDRFDTFTSFELELLQEDYADLDRRVTALDRRVTTLENQ